MKKYLLPVIVAALIAALFASSAFAEPNAAAPAPRPAGTASPRDWGKLAPEGMLRPEQIKGDSAILIDACTGKVLFDKHADDRRYPASTTKIMTCLIALKSGKDFSDIVTIGALPHADFIDGSDNIGLKRGETISFGDLLAGMMVHSGNDAADAIAMEVGGSIENFLSIMNQEARELGMAGTHYTSANGLADDTNHYTTPADMAKLALAAVKFAEFAKLASYSEYKMSPDDVHPSPTAWMSTNHLLLNDAYGYQYATGIKTGYTGMAQSSLVSSAKKDGMSLIAVDMHVENRNPDLWVDSITMLEYGFRYYDTVDLQELFGNRTIPLAVKGTAGDDAGKGSLELTLRPRSQAFLTDRRDIIQKLKSDPSQLHNETAITKDTAPIKRDEAVGTVTYFYEEKPVLICDLIATRDVKAMAAPVPSALPTATADKGNPSATVGVITQTPHITAAALFWLGGVVLLAAVAIITLWLRNMRRRGRRSSQRNLRQGNL